MERNNNKKRSGNQVTTHEEDMEIMRSYFASQGIPPQDHQKFAELIESQRYEYERCTTNRNKKKKPLEQSTLDEFKLKFLPPPDPASAAVSRMQEEEEWAERVEREWDKVKQEDEERMIREIEQKERENKRKAAKDQAWRDAHAKEMDEIIEFEVWQARMEETPAERLARFNREDQELADSLALSRAQSGTRDSFKMMNKSVPETITESELVRTPEATKVRSVPVAVTTEKQASPPIPTSATAGDDASEDDALSVSNKFEGVCSMCGVAKYKCHKKELSLYCIDALLDYFRTNPLESSRKKYVKVFTLAYNRGMDYKSFDDNLKLNPCAFYYPPACMMKEFRDFLLVLEKDKYDYINGKTRFQPEHERPKTLADLDLSEEHTVDGPTQVCGDCGKSVHKCHHQLFGEYCFAHLHRAFLLFPSAVTEENARKIYLRWYNSALHYHIWTVTFTYVGRVFEMPPKCLERQMVGDIKIIMDKRAKLQVKDEAVTDWGLNFYGMEIED